MVDKVNLRRAYEMQKLQETIEKSEAKIEHLFNRIFDYIDEQHKDLPIVSVKEELVRLVKENETNKRKLDAFLLDNYPTDLSLVQFFMIEDIDSLECFCVKKGYFPYEVYEFLTGENYFEAFKEIGVEDVRGLLKHLPREEGKGWLSDKEIDTRLEKLGQASYQSTFRGSLLVYGNKVV